MSPNHLLCKARLCTCSRLEKNTNSTVTGATCFSLGHNSCNMKGRHSFSGEKLNSNFCVCYVHRHYRFRLALVALGTLYYILPLKSFSPELHGRAVITAIFEKCSWSSSGGLCQLSLQKPLRGQEDCLVCHLGKSQKDFLAAALEEPEALSAALKVGCVAQW